MPRQYGTASERANQWLRDQGYSQGQLNDAYSKIREKQNSGMSNQNIISDIRNNKSNYIDNPMYGNSGGGDDEYVPTWEELHPAVNRNVGGRDFNLQTHEDGSITVTVGGQERTIDKNHSQYNTISNYLNGITSKQTSTNPNTTGNESGIGDQVTGTRDSKWRSDYDSRVDSNLKKGMSREDAFNEASEFMNRDKISTTKQEEEAAAMSSSDDDDIDSKVFNEQIPTDQATEEPTNYNKNEDPTNGGMDGEGYSEEERERFKNLFGFYPEEANDLKDSLQSWADDITNSLESSSTTSKVVNNASVPRDSTYDYNTYFKENLAPEPNVGQTGKVKTKPYDDSIKDVKTYQDEAISSLESLGFLEPNTEAAATMPNTEEQTTPEIAETPESLVQGFDNELTELGSSTGLAPQAVAQTYVNYKNKLAKYIKDNNISDEEAAAMYDQLKNNEKFRDLLTQTNK